MSDKKQTFTRISNIIIDEINIPALEKMVLIILVRFNFNDTCYPSQLSIQKRSGLSMPTIKRVIKNLSTKKCITIVSKIGSVNHYRIAPFLLYQENSGIPAIPVSLRYQYHTDTSITEIPDQYHTDTTTSITEIPDQYHTDTQQLLLKTTSIKTTSKTTKKEKIVCDLTTFEELYFLHPKHVAKEDAKKAWIQLNPDDGLIETIRSSLKAWVASGKWNDVQYVPAFGVWLRNKRWTDELPIKLRPTVTRPKVSEHNESVFRSALQKHQDKHESAIQITHQGGDSEIKRL